MGLAADEFTIATCRLKGDRFGDGHCNLRESTAKVAAGPVEEEQANGGKEMKKVEAIIRPERVNSVIAALGAAGHHGVTVYEVAGHGKQRSHAERQVEEVQLRPKVMLVIVVKDAELDRVVKVIMETAKTDMMGDGRIFVSELSDFIRIRTGDHNDKAMG